MSLSICTAAVCLIACHGAPADHFATYSEALRSQGFDVHIYAAGPALKKFQERGLEISCPFALENLQPEEEDALAQQLAAACATAALVLTDVGHAFDIKIHRALHASAAHAPHLAYYDNPEPFVPGGYSYIAAQVMQNADGILFANQTLASATIYSEFAKSVDFNGKKRTGIGYYPTSQAEKIAQLRELAHQPMRAALLAQHAIQDSGQRVCVYFGGNNEEYFSKAFPAFLAIIAQASQLAPLSDMVIAIQQHPGAKMENLDGQQLAAWLEQFAETSALPKIIVSEFSADDAQVIAEAAFYYQTSMAPQFVLEGIPTVQIGHETYADILIRNNLAPSVTNAAEFLQVVEGLRAEVKHTPQKELLWRDLGIRQDWPETLGQAIKDAMPSPPG